MFEKINGRLDTTEEKISELEPESLEFIQTEVQREGKTMSQWHMRHIKPSDIYLTRVSESKESKKKAEKYLKKYWLKTIKHFIKDSQPPTQQVWQISSKRPHPFEDVHAFCKVFADDTTLMAESEEELKRFLMKVKEESEKVGLKLNIPETKIMASCPITSWQIDGETVADFIFLGSKSLQMMTAAIKLKDAYSLEGKLWPTWTAC